MTEKANNYYKMFHAPDEECPHCGVEFPAIKIKKHQRECLKKKNEVQHNLIDSENNLELEEVERREPIKSQKQEIERASSKGGGDQLEWKGKIRVKYGQADKRKIYTVKVDPERKKKKVMRKLAMMIDKPVDQLMFMVERSDKVISARRW